MLKTNELKAIMKVVNAKEMVLALGRGKSTAVAVAKVLKNDTADAVAATWDGFLDTARRELRDAVKAMRELHKTPNEWYAAADLTDTEIPHNVAYRKGAEATDGAKVMSAVDLPFVGVAGLVFDALCLRGMCELKKSDVTYTKGKTVPAWRAVAKK